MDRPELLAEAHASEMPSFSDVEPTQILDTEPSVEHTIVILNGISDAIEKVDILDLQMYIGQLEISNSTTPEDFRALFLQMIDLCVTVDSPDAAEIVVDRFSMFNPNEDRFLPLVIEMYLWSEISVKQLKLIARAKSQLLRFIYVVDQLIGAGDGHILTLGMERARDVFEPQSLQTYRTLHERAREAGTSRIMIWLESQISMISNKVGRPEWVRNFSSAVVEPGTGGPIAELGTGGPILPIAETYQIPEPPNITFYLPSPEEAAKIILESSGYYGLDVSKTEQSLHAIADLYQAATDEKKLEMLSEDFRVSYMQKLADDETFTRLIGPRHPLTRFISDDYQHPCLKYGGCAMLTCNHYGVLEDDEEIDELGATPDWYTGFCQYRECLQKIPFRCWAIREPVSDGGWRGCYHSFDCIKQDMEERDGDYAVNNLDISVLEEFREDLLRVGIQDRKSNLPILNWPDTIGDIHPGEIPLDALLPTDVAPAVII